MAARVKEYAELGIDTFICSGYPHLEESYRVAELLFPHLPVSKPQAAAPTVSYVSPFGELVANQVVPPSAPRIAASASKGSCPGSSPCWRWRHGRDWPRQG